MARKKEQETMGTRVRQELTGLVFLAAGGLCLAALLGEGTGVVGGFAHRVMRTLLGDASWMVPVLLGVIGFVQVARREGSAFAGPRVAGLLLAVVAVAAFFHLGVPLEDAFEVASDGQAGGMLGAAVIWALTGAFGRSGRMVALVSMVAAALLLVINRPLRDLGAAAWNLLSGMGRRGVAEPVKPRAGRQVPASEPAAAADAGTDDQRVLDGPPVRFDDPDGDEPERPEPGRSPRPRRIEGKEGAEGDEFRQVTLSDDVLYQVPPLTLLRSVPRRRYGADGRQVAARARLLEETLVSFGVQARVINTASGPAVTRFELQPAPGVKVSRIVALADDIALSMAASDVRVVAPIPGKALVGIEVPNPHISPVMLREVLETSEFQGARSRLAIGLGKDIAGRPIVTDLERMLHLLIAGATGSGKSICLNSIIASILFKARPGEVKLLLIDPKRVELSGYDGIPHLLSPVVTDPKKAASCLRWAVREMERRYEVFADLGVRDIYRFNEKSGEAEDESVETMPHLVVVIDELADLMSVAPADVEDAIQRLAQMARAAGIHLVVATQRPSVDVITGIIKANIPSRIAFAVSSAVDSRTILDTGGADKLLGKGDMLFSPVGASKPVRVQGSFVSEAELEALLSFIRGQGKPEFDQEVVNLAPDEIQAGEDDDELVMRALEVVVDGGQASVSGLQRRLRVGYTRAGRLIDILERMGHVGPHQGSKPRDVYITRDEYERLRARDDG